jgi:hypothetical protein
MADTVMDDAPATITEVSLKNALAERLGAVHVEVTDMSGRYSFSGAPKPLFVVHPEERRLACSLSR